LTRANIAKATTLQTPKNLISELNDTSGSRLCPNHNSKIQTLMRSTNFPDLILFILYGSANCVPFFHTVKLRKLIVPNPGTLQVESQQAHPPSIEWIAPVMKLDSSLNKNATKFATSNGLPTRFRAVWLLSNVTAGFPAPAICLALETIGVSIVPLIK
jgi:hypothetical protein